MKRAPLSIGLALGLLALATPASAGWQFTEWGMSPEEVVAASGGRARPIDEGNGWLLKLPGPYAVGDAMFEYVKFRFENGRLERVTLRAAGDQGSWIARGLAGAVGPPTYVEGGGSVSRRLYRDAAKANAIELHDFGEAVFLTYTVIPAF